MSATTPCSWPSLSLSLSLSAINATAFRWCSSPAAIISALVSRSIVERAALPRSLQERKRKMAGFRPPPVSTNCRGKPGNDLGINCPGSFWQLPRPRRMLQLAQCLGFDLANTFARHAELLADFFQRVVGVHADAEAHAQHAFLARGQTHTSVVVRSEVSFAWPFGRSFSRIGAR